MNANELREAAEYVITEAYPQELRDRGVVRKTEYEYDQKAVQLARYVLETVKADDGEPVTEKWLQSVGFEVVWPDDPEFSHLRCGWLLRTTDKADGSISWYAAESFDSEDFPDQRTRGDVRRLCRALGITLNEEASR